jgi:hypothetical protein
MNNEKQENRTKDEQNGMKVEQQQNNRATIIKYYTI